MAWWELKFNVPHLTDADKGHIAKMVEKGYTSGQLNEEEKEVHCPDCDEKRIRDQAGYCTECGANLIEFE